MQTNRFGGVFARLQFGPHLSCNAVSSLRRSWCDRNFACKLSGTALKRKKKKEIIFLPLKKFNNICLPHHLECKICMSWMWKTWKREKCVPEDRQAPDCGRQEVGGQVSILSQADLLVPASTLGAACSPDPWLGHCPEVNSSSALLPLCL